MSAKYNINDCYGGLLLYFIKLYDLGIVLSGSVWFDIDEEMNGISFDINLYLSNSE